MTTAPIKAGDSAIIDDTLLWGGVVIDLTGSTFYIVVKEKNGTPRIKKQAALQPGSVATDGKVRVTLAPADTINLAGTFYFEWLVVWLDGTEKTVPTGSYYELPILPRL